MLSMVGIWIDDGISCTAGFSWPYLGWAVGEVNVRRLWRHIAWWWKGMEGETPVTKNLSSSTENTEMWFFLGTGLDNHGNYAEVTPVEKESSFLYLT